MKEEFKYLTIKKLVETKSEKSKIQTNIIALEDDHPRQPKCQYLVRKYKWMLVFMIGLVGLNPVYMLE